MTPPIGTRQTAAALVVVALTIAMAGTPVAAQSDADPAFVVDVQNDGSAKVSVRSTLDLTTDGEREAFQSLVDDDQAQQDATARFLDRMRSVARDAENATGRQMRVADARIDLRTTADGETGVVTLSVAWAGLAAVEGETLTVTEPFVSGFTTDRPFVLRAPDGYTITSATPAPDATGEAEATWNAGTDLSGFAVELQAATTDGAGADGDSTRTDGQPGFGWAAAAAALIAAGLAATARGWTR